MRRSSVILWAVFLVWCSSAYGALVTSLSELALLPPYCKGTQTIRDLSHDPVSLEQYEEIYGRSFIHLHHYCWALNSENKANSMFNKRDRDFQLNSALIDIKYVLTNASADFVLLPEIYNSRARILFSLHRDPEAVLSLEKAIALKPGFVPAVARLSDYFASIGDKAKAIQTLKSGIENTENADFLIGKLTKLGVTYQGTPGSAVKKDERQDDQAVLPVAGETAPDASPSHAASSVPAAPSQPANNPYCRFCP